MKKLILLYFLLIVINVKADIYFSVQSGNWSNSSTWGCFFCFTATPISTDIIFIQSGHTINLDVNFQLSQNSIMYLDGNLIDVSSSRTLTIGNSNGNANTCSNGYNLEISSLSTLRVNNLTIQRACVYTSNSAVVNILNNLTIINSGQFIINTNVITNSLIMNAGTSSLSGSGFLSVLRCVNSTNINISNISVIFCVNATNCTNIPSNVQSLNPLFFRCNTSLPIQLKYFLVTKENEKVKIEWQNYQRFNSKKYIIQKSKNLIDWNTIFEINLSELSNVLETFLTIDELHLGITYYKLLHIDLNDNIDFEQVSKIINDEFYVTIYPNPSSNIFNIESNFDDKSMIRVYDLTGKIVKEFYADKLHNFSFILQQKGMFYVIISNNTFKKNFKIINE